MRTLYLAAQSRQRYTNRSVGANKSQVLQLYVGNVILHTDTLNNAAVVHLLLIMLMQLIALYSVVIGLKPLNADRQYRQYYESN